MFHDDLYHSLLLCILIGRPVLNRTHSCKFNPFGFDLTQLNFDINPFWKSFSARFIWETFVESQFSFSHIFACSPEMLYQVLSQLCCFFNREVFNDKKGLSLAFHCHNINHSSPFSIPPFKVPIYFPETRVLWLQCGISLRLRD